MGILIAVVGILIYGVTVLLNWALYVTYAMMLKTQSQEKVNNRLGETKFLIYVFPFFLSLIPVLNLAMTWAVIEGISEEKGDYKKVKTNNEKMKQNPHLESYEHFKKMYDVWCPVYRLTDNKKDFSDTLNAISKNLDNPAIKYLLLEHETMFVESVVVQEEIKKFDRQYKEEVETKWIEIIIAFNEEVVAFQKMENKVADQVQKKKVEQLLQEAEFNLNKVKKRTLQTIYSKTNA